VKKIVSILICVTMLASALVPCVFAADNPDGYSLSEYGQMTFEIGKATAKADGVVNDNEYTWSVGPYKKADDAARSEFFVVDPANETDNESFSLFASYDDDHIYFASVVKNGASSLPNYGKTSLYLGDTTDIAKSSTIDVIYANGSVTCKSDKVDASRTKAVVDKDSRTLTVEFAVKRSAIEKLDKYFMRFYIGFYSGSAIKSSINIGFKHTFRDFESLAKISRFPHVFTLTNSTSTVKVGDIYSKVAGEIVETPAEKTDFSGYGQKSYDIPKLTNPTNLDGKIGEGEYEKLFEGSVVGIKSKESDPTKTIVVYDSTGNASKVAYYASYDDKNIYLAATTENVAGKPHEFGKLYVALGSDYSNLKNFTATTIKYSGEEVEGGNYFISVDGDTITYELVISRSSIAQSDSYLLRMALYMYGDGASGPDESAYDKVGSATFGFYSPTLYSEGYNAGVKDRFPHELKLSTKQASGGAEVPPADQYELDKFGQRHFYAGLPTTKAPTYDGVVSEGEYSLNLGTYVLDNDALDNTFRVFDYARESVSFTAYASYDDNYVYIATVLQNVEGVVPTAGRTICYLGNTANIYDQRAVDLKYTNGRILCTDGASYVDSSKMIAKPDEENYTMTFEFAVKRSAVPTDLGKYFLRLYLTTYNNGADAGSINFGFMTNDYITEGDAKYLVINNEYIKIRDYRRIPHVLHLGVGVTQLDSFGQLHFDSPFARESMKLDGVITEGEYDLIHTVDEKASYYSSYNNGHIYLAAVVKNAPADLSVFFGENEDLSIFKKATLTPQGKLESESDAFDGCAVKVDGDTTVYELSIDRSKVEKIDTYFVRMALEGTDGALDLGFKSDELKAAGFSAADGNNFPHTLTISGKETVHKYKNALKISDTQHKFVCTRCDFGLKIEDHTFGEAVTLLEPTATASGVKAYYCTECGYTKNETIVYSTTVSLNIAWTNAEFVYSAGEWKENEALDVKVENSSDVGLNLSFEWAPRADGIEAEFDGVDRKGDLELAKNAKAEVSFKLGKTKAEESKRMGDVTLSVSPASVSDRFIYDHVVILGLDGIGNFRLNGSTPNIDRIFGSQAITDVATTSLPSGTGPCWLSLFTGVDPSILGVNTNPGDGLTAANATFAEANKKFETSFEQIYDKYGKNSSVSIVAWHQMNNYVFGDCDGLVKINADGYSDPLVKELALEYINGKGGKEMPKLLYLHFDNIDARGHQTGYNSATYHEGLTRTDGYVGEIYDALEKQGYLENTLVILATDHGGIGTTHGGASEAEMTITLGFAGKSVLPVRQFDMTIRDLATVIGHALDLSEPEQWTEVSVPEYLFSDNVK